MQGFHKAKNLSDFLKEFLSPPKKNWVSQIEKESLLLYLYHVNDLAYFEIGEEMTIGRTTGEIICAEDGRMSGKHVQLSVELVNNEEQIFIQDLGSKNRTAVNREEIPPNQKRRLKTYSLVETGDQKFVVTDSKDVNIQDLSDMIDKHLKRSLITLEDDATTPPLPLIEEASPYEIAKKKEANIIQIQKEILQLEQTAKSELIKLEEAKEKLIINAKAKKLELTKQMNTLKSEVDEAKIQMAKIKAELELKKKKIINLKDIPTESTEEFPE